MNVDQKVTDHVGSVPAHVQYVVQSRTFMMLANIVKATRSIMLDGIELY